MEINRLSQLRARAFENMTAIATCNYPGSVPDCNGNSTVFDGMAYLPGEGCSRDTCILRSGEQKGIYICELDLAMLRDYRKDEVFGNAYRHPEKIWPSDQGKVNRTLSFLKQKVPLSACLGEQRDFFPYGVIFLRYYQADLLYQISSFLSDMSVQPLYP